MTVLYIAYTLNRMKMLTLGRYDSDDREAAQNSKLLKVNKQNNGEINMYATHFILFD